MQTKIKKLFFLLVIVAMLALPCFGATQALAVDKGVFRMAIHWGISSRYLVPSEPGSYTPQKLCI